MSKGNNGIFKRTNVVALINKNPINKVDYNRAGSLDVETVNQVNKTTSHGITIKGHPNSVNQKHDKRGSLISERYYNDSGYAYLDIDYTNHGNPKTHPEVPHQHEIKIKGNNIRRKKRVKIRK